VNRAIATDALVAVEAVSFGYPLSGGRRREVLRDVDLRLAQGELVSLVGTNGSGKTTLLRLLSGVLTPDDADRDLEHSEGDVVRGDGSRAER
jgi:ABC-type polysaccharide/polyol phosphate transport system ATPase subunit